MIEAYIYDTVRTPRGTGKETGSLHQISPIKLASKTLRKIKDRKAENTPAVVIKLGWILSLKHIKLIIAENSIIK